MAALHDKYLTGTVGGPQRVCPICKEKTLCAHITGIILPPGVTLRATILMDKAKSAPNRRGHDDDPAVAHHHIGVGCGCYAKFHRQLAHITG